MVRELHKESSRLEEVGKEMIVRNEQLSKAKSGEGRTLSEI